jgi:hypothetical protein
MPNNNSDISYPVMEERILARAGRRMLARTRDLSELPTQRPGSVLVFEVGSGYIAFTERRHLAGREELVVNAVSVSVVDVRPRTVTVQLAIPSSNPADDFIVLADFGCRVDEPEAVVAAGLRDVSATLRQYLRQDTSLNQLAARRSVEQINEVRMEVAARIEAYYRLRAPRIAGMSVGLLDVRVVTPKDLATHERKMRDTRWQQRHEALEHRGEDRNAERMRGYFEGGATSVAGLAAARGELNLSQATEREYAALQSKREDLIKLWESLPEAYRDTVAVDAQRIVDSVFDQILSTGGNRKGIESRRSIDPGASSDDVFPGRDDDGD